MSREHPGPLRIIYLLGRRVLEGILITIFPDGLGGKNCEHPDAGEDGPH